MKFLETLLIMQYILNFCTSDLCPELCTCDNYWVSQEELSVIVNCVGKGLVELPQDIPFNTTELYLADNPDLNLNNINWSRFRILTALNLENNNIAHFQVGYLQISIRIMVFGSGEIMQFYR